MIQDKEYPATHSMSTAWYMVDDDDNVAIIEYNENGPVPWDVPEAITEDLLFGPPTGVSDSCKTTIELTEEQIIQTESPHFHTPHNRQTACT